MKEYIEREAALKAFEPQCGDWSECWSAEEIKQKLDNIPAADVVEVVRCKDCRHRDPEDHKCDCGHDILWQLPRDDDWFCADGERKGGCGRCRFLNTSITESKQTEKG